MLTLTGENESEFVKDVDEERKLLDINYETFPFAVLTQKSFL